MIPISAHLNHETKNEGRPIQKQSYNETIPCVWWLTDEYTWTDSQHKSDDEILAEGDMALRDARLWGAEGGLRRIQAAL